MKSKIMQGNCLKTLKTLSDNSIDSIVTDPPYELGFMGKSWDSSGIAFNVDVWQECLRVLKPGGHLLAFSGSRTYHRMACAIEDAGFQIRDQIMWVYGSGFPKSLNISKAIDKAAGAERKVIGKIRNNQPGGTSAFAEGGIGSYQRGDTTERDVVGGPATDEAKQWDGWGTALKPAHEPIVLARKPLDGTVANNVLTHGVGGINIDGCRVDFVSDEDKKESTTKNQHQDFGTKPMTDNTVYGDYSMIQPTNYNPPGRFPANFIHDGSNEVLELFPITAPSKAALMGSMTTEGSHEGWKRESHKGFTSIRGFNDLGGSAARFFYCAKASKKERNEGLDGFEPKREADRIIDDGVGGDNPRNRSNTPKANHHPTVKPTDLMRYLCKLVTPPNGIVLDPFTGSGSTLVAAKQCGFKYVGCELDKEYIKIARARLKKATK